MFLPITQILSSSLSSGWLSDGKPLKPNYSEKFGYEADKVPSAWAKRVKAYVTNIEFAE